jgi:hypothetical protein
MPGYNKIEHIHGHNHCGHSDEHSDEHNDEHNDEHSDEHNDDYNDDYNKRFIQSIFGHHADPDSLMKRLEDDYGVSLHSGEKYPPVHMTNPFRKHILTKTCKIVLPGKRGHGHGHGRGHGTLKRRRGPGRDHVNSCGHK